MDEYIKQIESILYKRFDVKFEFDGDYIKTKSKQWNDKYKSLILCKSIKNVITLADYVDYSIGDDNFLARWVRKCEKIVMKDNDYSEFWLIFKHNFSSSFVIYGEYNKEGWRIYEPIYLGIFLSKIIER